MTGHAGAPPTDEDLAALEATVGRALASQDTTGLTVLGIGEISLALGWPADEPRFVCKRTARMTATQHDAYASLIADYVDALRAGGVPVIDTAVRAVPDQDRLVTYLVQPKVAAETLGHNVLGAASPDADHPLLAAVAGTLDVVTDRLSLDAQITNFSWVDGEVTLLDVGSPFLWDRAGRLRFDLEPYTPMIPAPLRTFIKNDMLKVVDRWREPRRVAVDVVANLYRERMEDWVEPAIVALNRALPGEGVTAEEARAFHQEDLKTFPRLTRLQRVERAWRTKVRRRPYDFFIHTTMDGAHID